MSDDPRFDVHVTGARAATPAAELRLAAAIAGRFRLPAPAVAEALTRGACVVARAVARAEADAVAVAVAALGGIARVEPAAGIAPDDIADDPRDGAGERRRDGRITLRSANATVPPAIVDISGPMETAQPGTDARVASPERDRVRCPIHGLTYNRRLASGCTRCLAPARARARKLVEESGAHFGGPLPSDGDGASAPPPGAARRAGAVAFMGLAIALVVGFAPALYYARAVNAAEVRALRAEQAGLSAEPATRAVLDRFDALDAAATRAHRRGAGRTLLIWLGVGGVVGLAWAKLAPRR